MLRCGNWSESLPKLVSDEGSFVFYHYYRPAFVNFTQRVPTSLKATLTFVLNGYIYKNLSRAI